jgi:deoxyadenosine/deoxycytidine kinase
MTVIITSGNISAGKSTVSKLLAKHLGVRLFEESVDNNPFLDLYYKDPKRWAFTLQTYFLNTRWDAIQQALQNDNYILDRSIYEDRDIFAQIQYEQGSMTFDEYQTYLHFFDRAMSHLKQLEGKRRPDLLIHLEGSIDTILYRWRKRSRSYEMQDGMIEYLIELNKRYEKWIETFDICPVLRVNIDEIDVTREEDAKKFLIMVDNKLSEMDREFKNKNN